MATEDALVWDQTPRSSSKDHNARSLREAAHDCHTWTGTRTVLNTSQWLGSNGLRHATNVHSLMQCATDRWHTFVQHMTETVTSVRDESWWQQLLNRNLHFWCVNVTGNWIVRSRLLQSRITKTWNINRFKKFFTNCGHFQQITHSTKLLISYLSQSDVAHDR